MHLTLSNNMCSHLNLAHDNETGWIGFNYRSPDADPLNHIGTIRTIIGLVDMYLTLMATRIKASDNNKKKK